MIEVILFAGTSEGREIAQLLKARGIAALACVATEYGKSLLEAGGSLQLHAGRLDQNMMAALIQKHNPRIVIDATHPYAAEAGSNLRHACRATGTEYWRVLRESAAHHGSLKQGVVEFDSLRQMTDWLDGAEGVIFSALGAKHARELTRVKGFEERIWLRILPFAEGLSGCIEAGFPASRIICMQGPFSKELNAAMFHAARAKILITKESGAPGGFSEKLAAARECEMIAAVLRRPGGQEGFSLEEIKQKIGGMGL